MSQYNMLCFAEPCIRTNNQFYNYTRDRVHRTHTPVKMLHPAHFTEVFTPQNLFSKQEQERIVDQLRGYFALWKEESLAMVVKLIDGLRDTFEAEIQEFLKLFQDENEEELVKVLGQARQDGELLQILNRYFLDRDKTLKQVICDMLSTKETTYQLKFTALHDSFRKVFSKFTQQPDPTLLSTPRTSPKRQQKTEPLKYDHQTIPKPIQIPLIDAADQPLARSICNNSVLSLHSDNKLNISEINRDADSQEMEQMLAGLDNSGEEEEHERIFRARIDNVYSFAIMNADPQRDEAAEKDHERGERELITLREEEEEDYDDVIEITPPGRGKQPPKRKSIKKELKQRKREGRKSNHPPPPLYDNLFLQIDMDYFFSKNATEPDMPALSDCAASPYFNPHEITSLCLRTENDLTLLEQHPTIQSNVQSLTLSHPIRVIEVVPYFLTLEERLTTIHLKDIHLKDEEIPKLRQLLRCHSNSLQCLMLEACWNLPTAIVEDIAKLKNLNKLKLHSTYNRPFPLQLRLLFGLKELQYLSISSAQFVDSCGDLIEYGNSRWLDGIRSLSKLIHLGLYNCNKVYSDLLSYFHDSVYSRLTYLNIGITDIDEKVVEHLRKFEALLYLNVDETQLNGADIAKIFLNRKDVKLKELSLVNLNGITWQEMNRGYRNGLLKCYDLEKLAEFLPHLEYINLLGCHLIQGFDLQRFKNLKYAYAQEGIFNKKMIKKFELAKIQIFIESIPQSKPENLIAEPETKVEYDPYTSAHFLSDKCWE